ncbi:MAG: alpha/beta hydrolase [Bacteroidota bacterium]|nr:alpha/beta hydrolase [Bacteroidota bacterium]
MKSIIIITSILFYVITAQAQEFIPLWPKGKKPNTNGTTVKDSLFNERIWRVGTPGMYAFPVPKSENTGTAVLICPGGGYERLSHIYNGFQVARWFNANGINAFVLIYRLPHQTDLKDRPIAPLQDAQRAMRIIRGNAKQWGVQPDKIGIFGTSAGGHVASTLGTHFQDVSTINDSLDAINYRADFMVLVSPVISMGTFAHPGSKKNLLGAQPSKEGIEKYSNELQVSSATPPAFIVHALNDSTVPVQNSLLFYQALVDKKVNATLHIFPQGGHGIKMYDNPGSTDLFPQLLLLWLREKGYLTTKN